MNELEAKYKQACLVARKAKKAYEESELYQEWVKAEQEKFNIYKELVKLIKDKQIFYVGTYDNGSGYREFIDTPVATIEEAQKQLGRACGMDEKVEECYYSTEHKQWVLVEGFIQD